MKRSADGPYQWIFYLTAAFLFGGYALRALLVYRDNPALSQVLELLAAWLGLFASETTISRRWSGYFPIYLVLQTILVVVLLSLPGSPDYFAVLFAILGMQVMQRFAPRLGAVWIGLWALLMALALAESYGVARAIAFALIYTFMNVFLAFYALTTRRAQTARARNQALAQELQEANRQLQATSTQLERLAVARERQRLARELHDSVTQTIFSMTLTTQSALLLLDRDPSRVGAQLDRLGQLGRSALAEMQVLISELRPEIPVAQRPGFSPVGKGRLVPALRHHLTDGHLPEYLSVSLEVEGDGLLGPVEEQGLFRIAQEALNNVVKHAQASQACIRLHLAEPYSMEIEDQGQGFDLQQARTSGRVGLVSMAERSAEIGWELHIITAPGAGTRIRVEKKLPSTGL